MRFIPTVTSLEPRYALDGAPGPDLSGMPNGMEAFEYPYEGPNPPIFADGALIMDIYGNLPGSDYYLSGPVPDPDNAPNPYTAEDIDYAYKKLFPE